MQTQTTTATATSYTDQQKADFLYKLYSLSVNEFFDMRDIQATTEALMAKYGVTFYTIERLRKEYRNDIASNLDLNVEYRMTQAEIDTRLDWELSDDAIHLQLLSFDNSAAYFFDLTSTRDYEIARRYERACLAHMDFSTFNPEPAY